MTGLESSVPAISCTLASASSVASPSISSSNRLPCRTSVTPEKPRRGRAPWTALPWGSRISGLSMTSTTTRATEGLLGKGMPAVVSVVTAAPGPGPGSYGGCGSGGLGRFGVVVRLGLAGVVAAGGVGGVVVRRGRDGEREHGGAGGQTRGHQDGTAVTWLLLLGHAPALCVGSGHHDGPGTSGSADRLLRAG